MGHPAEDVETLRWIDKYVRQVVKDELNNIGIPKLFLHGVVDSVYTNGTKTFANVFINGATTVSSNIPVNPSEASNITRNSQVWVIAVNFNNLDLFVLCRKPV